MIACMILKGRCLCKTPFPSLLRRQEPSLKRSFSCRADSRHQNMTNQIFDFTGSLLYSERGETSKALLCTGHPPSRARRIAGFAKVTGRLNIFSDGLFYDLYQHTPAKPFSGVNTISVPAIAAAPGRHSSRPTRPRSAARWRFPDWPCRR